ncbi:MAG: hypothetical protein KOO63_05515 [Bacteroidales bacterium]|nr:hypothetical protein [Candidatus Latescibacterota bacterium]
MADYAPPLNNPWFQAFDSSGAPLSGGKVRTYEAGTSTPKVTWQDGGMSSANANPVILNSYGMAAIFGEGLYKIELYDSDDNLIDTIDYVLALQITDDARDLLAQASATAMRSSLGLGTAATKDAGTDGGEVLLLDDDAKLPVLDGSNLTNIGGSAASVPPEHLSGLTLSYSAVTTFGVSAGKCRDSTDSTSPTLASNYTKTLSGWVVGTGNGSLQSGLSIIVNTWYAVHLIYNPESDTTDIMISTSASSPTLPTGYTTFRRIGWIKTDSSSQIKDFSQDADTFLWKETVEDRNAAGDGNIDASPATTQALTVPPDSSVSAIITATAGTNAVAGSVYFSSLSIDDEAPNEYTTAPFPQLAVPLNTGVRFSTGQIEVRVNSSGQIRIRPSQDAYAVDVCTLGWLDNRGVNA